MSDKLDQILGILDVGIQSSREHGYGDDFDPAACSRCQDAEPAPNGDLCVGCRSYLLGDSDHDPTAVQFRGRRILGDQPDGPPVFDEAYHFPSLPEGSFPRRHLNEWTWTRPQRRVPINVDDTAIGLLCVGGPMDGRMAASDGPFLRAIVPQDPVSWLTAEAEPMAMSIETVTYERRKVAWRDGEQVFLASCWVFDDASGQSVIDALNGIAAWCRLVEGSET